MKKISKLKSVCGLLIALGFSISQAHADRRLVLTTNSSENTIGLYPEKVTVTIPDSGEIPTKDNITTSFGGNITSVELSDGLPREIKGENTKGGWEIKFTGANEALVSGFKPAFNRTGEFTDILYKHKGYQEVRPAAKPEAKN